MDSWVLAVVAFATSDVNVYIIMLWKLLVEGTVNAEDQKMTEESSTLRNW